MIMSWSRVGWSDMGFRVVVLKFGCDLLQMRGLEWLVSSDNTVVLRLGLLGHILDLRKFRIFVLSCIGCVIFSFPFVSSSLSSTHRYCCVVVLYFFVVL